MKHSQILIFSIEEDYSTSNVIRWIHFLAPSVEVIRIHPEDIVNGIWIHDLSDDNIEFTFRNIQFNSDNITSIWTRKWHSDIVSISTDDVFLEKSIMRVKKNMIQEYINIYDYLIHVLEQNKNIHWLNRPQYASPNKLVQLKMAKASGLSVPHSYVANIYSEKIPHKSLITKPFSNSCSIEYDGKLYNNYTSRISRNCFPKSFFLSYFQEEIRKALELRIFYLKGDCYALSIHSQENSKTSIDYRQYDHSHQNRLEPYELPKALVEKINLFMEKMDIQTGSLDFIYTLDEEFIFIEVNPSGQYDIFNSCNVYPDKLIAEHLINKPI